jgi:predicted nucleic acid-binding protein
LKRTFIDSGVLIAAAIGSPDISHAAREILDDPDRKFVSSEFIRLEVCPKAKFYGHDLEAAFYAAFFESVGIWVPVTELLTDLAYEEACTLGLSALDALHVAAAALSHCEEIVTTEKPFKPIHRFKAARVASLLSSDG